MIRLVWAGGDLGERRRERRRPRIDSLYDVFVNVRNDEAEHMKTMQFCQLPGTILRAPSEAAACSVTYNGARGYEGAGLGEDAPPNPTGSTRDARGSTRRRWSERARG